MKSKQHEKKKKIPCPQILSNFRFLRLLKVGSALLEVVESFIAFLNLKWKLNRIEERMGSWATALDLKVSGIPTFEN